MPPSRSSGMLTFPDFRGFTRTLILWNLGVYFLMLLLRLAVPAVADRLLVIFTLSPIYVAHGYVWQIVTYSFFHVGLLATALELLSIWFLSAFLEATHGVRWVAELYFISIAGAALTAIVLAFATSGSGGLGTAELMGAFGGIFGLLMAFAVLYGDMQFTLFPLPIAIKAKYLAAIYILIAFAEAFGQSRIFAISELGGALFGFLYVKGAPRRGVTAGGGRIYQDFRNDYYRWKRRRAARKFEVYMRKQDRDVHFDSEGRYVDPDTGRPVAGHRGTKPGEPHDPNDRRWMN